MNRLLRCGLGVAILLVVAAVAAPDGSAAPTDGTVYAIRRDTDPNDAMLCVDGVAVVSGWAPSSMVTVAVAEGTHDFKTTTNACDDPAPAYSMLVTADRPHVIWSLTAVFQMQNRIEFISMGFQPLVDCPTLGQSQLVAANAFALGPGQPTAYVPFVDDVQVPGWSPVGGAQHTISELAAGSHDFVSKMLFPSQQVHRGPFTDTAAPSEALVWFSDQDAAIAAHIPLAQCPTGITTTTTSSTTSSTTPSSTTSSTTTANPAASSSSTTTTAIAATVQPASAVQAVTATPTYAG